jgi:peptide/nickel transport system permease protein
VRSYIVKRLLIMIPTFFGISLLVFAVLNFAPGRPGAGKQGSDLASDVRGEGTQESYRIFLEQFGLDKPVLFNTLPFSLTRERVEKALRRMTGVAAASAAERVRAQDALEGWGTYSIPYLVEVVQQYDPPADDESRMLRDIGVYMLRLNARQQLVDPFNPKPAPEVRARNQQLQIENEAARQRRYALEDPESLKRPVLDAWYAWYAENSSRWDYSTAQKLRILLLETRFATYWDNLIRLDFGISLVSRKPVLETLVSKLRYSISLSVTSLILAYLISIPLGIYSAAAKDSLPDRVLTVVLFMLYSLPSFFVATVLLYQFSYGSDVPALRIFPTGGWRSRDYMDLTTLQQIGDLAWHLVLPIFCLTYGSLAALSRYMRTGLLDVIRSDYVRTARAKGLPEWQVIGKHAVRNGLIPVLTLLAGLLPAVLGGSVIIEVIFDIPGMGLWMIDSIYQRDYNVIMVIQLFATILTLVGILLTDLSYALVDPRIRYE